MATGFFLGVSLGVAGVVGAQQTETLNASWYGPGFEGRTTANGEIFDPSGFTAAHKTLPFGTTMEVCYEGCVNVRINDRGPFIAGRDLDLSQGAAEAIGLIPVGSAPVNVTYTDGSAPAGPSGGAAPAEQSAVQPTQTQPAEQPEAPPEAPVADTQQDQTNNILQTDNATDEQYAVEEPAGDSVADDQYEEPTADASAADEQYGPEDDSAADDQYGSDDASADASAADDQYSQPELDDAATDPAALAPLAPPEPSQVEVAPLELATPGSTVERRIALALAAPPENYEGALPEDPPAEIASVGQEAPVETAPEETPVETPVTEDESDASEGADEERPESGSVAAVAGLTVLPDTGGPPLMPLAGAVLALGLTVVGVRAFRR